MDRIGRYKIVRELGRGAMGVVYHAIDPNIGRPVAIKTIQFGGERKPEEVERMRERLFREARSAGGLSHPGIVTIYDVDQQGDLAYIAMEFVDGPTLEQVMSESSTLPSGRMFSVLGQTAVALDYAHSKGIVHRDIKPANIMIAADGTAKITDFGIAKITASEQLTMTGSIVGTPHYMSPEQVQGQPVDGRSDQFSLAVIAYEMLTGEKPYTGEHLTTVVYKIVAEEPAPPHRLNPSLTLAIESVLRRGLAKRPEGRYRACQEFTQSLEQACAESKGWKTMPRSGILNEPTVADVPSPAAAAPARPGTPALPPPRHPRREEAATAGEKRKSGFGVFLLVVLLVAAILALIGWQAAPWFLRPPPEPQAIQRLPPAPAMESAPPAPAQTAPESTPPADGAVAAAPDAATQEAKPSPMSPLPAPAASGEPREQRPAETPRASSTPQDVLVVSSPAGATARLDGNAATCSTPCTLTASPGKHSVAITAAGHQPVFREIMVGNGPMELAPVTLRVSGGTLMLVSDPAGATIAIDGQRIAQVTPANLTLAPGAYTVMVEKDGRQVTSRVEVKESVTTYRKIILNP